MVFRRTVFSLFIVLCVWVQVAAADDSAKPNIVLINVDDLGWADLACQGSKYYRTPNVDRLASQGMRFTNAYAAASNCAPSRACMLTGQYGPRHGIYTVQNSDRGKAKNRKLIPTRNTTSIAKDNLTIGGLLKNAGYQTITIGKWHVSDDPLKNGFDRNVAGNHIGHPMAKQGGYHSPFNYPNCVSEKEGEYLTDRLTDEAIKFASDNKDQPFFLYLSYYTVHTPIQPKADKRKKWKSIEKQPGQGNAPYAAMIESMDENIGRLITSLDELGIADQTVVIFTSDNGGLWQLSHQDPLRAGKGSYFEGGIRVPLIVRWPGKIEAASISDEPVIQVDFMPTIAEIAAVPIPAGKQFDGVSIAPVLTGAKEHLEKRALFWHFPIYLQASGRKKADFVTHDRWFRTRPGSVIRSGKWKLHEYFEDGRLELYDLENDIGETKNVAEDHAAIATQLHTELKSWRLRVNAPTPTKLNPKYQPDLN